MSKVDIISGFLGAGKTTLIKKLINEYLTHEKIVLIENEFGEIGIDGSFLKDTGVQITEMNSGCICCSLVGDFTTSLKQILQDYNPDRIIIEPSGVGKLSDVIKAIENTDEKNLILNSTVTVIDVDKCPIYSLNFGEFFNNQITYASTIILSKTENASQEHVQKAIDTIKKYNTKATIITTPWNQLSSQTMIEVIENKKQLNLINIDNESICPICGHDHHHNHHHHCHHDHHADDIFTSISIETIKTFTTSQLQDILKQLSNTEKYGQILRAKGILPSTEMSWLHFDYVPNEYDIRLGTSDYTGRLCVIGQNLNKDNIFELFGVK